MEPTIHTLSNGLRIVHLRVPGSAVGYTGVVVRAGSRDEATHDKFGLAHFVEHTLFKGTSKRTSWHIINRMEAVGGELNAYTTKEMTVVYTAFPRRYLSRALELIADLITGSTFPTAEINREREVIADEINSYLDSPADAVLDDFEDLMFKGTGLGHNILGTQGSVAFIESADCRRWLDIYYRADNMVAYYAGPAGADSFIGSCEKYFASLPTQPVSERKVRETLNDRSGSFSITRKVDTHQAHVVLGSPMVLKDYRKRLTMALLTNIIGGPGMNSRLNVALRERRGLVYTVESALTAWSDVSMFTTYFGTDADDVEKCLQLVRNIFTGLAEKPLPPRALKAAVKQYLGQLVLARENIENRVQGLARAVVADQPVMTPCALTELISGITSDEVMEVAKGIINMSVLAFVPNS